MYDDNGSQPTLDQLKMTSMRVGLKDSTNSSASTGSLQSDCTSAMRRAVSWSAVSGVARSCFSFTSDCAGHAMVVLKGQG